MRSLVNKSIKPIMMIVLTCLVALCFTGCASKSAELTKDGNFSNPPIEGETTGIASKTSNAIAVPINTNSLQLVQDEYMLPESFAITFTLVYLDSSSNVMFIDNVTETSIGAGYYCVDEKFDKSVSEYGDPKYVNAYITQVDASWADQDIYWGFSSTSLDLMEDPDYLEDTVKVLQEDGVYCGDAEIFG